MYSRSPFFKSTPWTIGALALVFLSGCFGDSENSTVDEESASGTGDSIEFGDAYWSELAQGYDEFVPEPGIGAAIDASDWVNLGRWGELINWPEIAVGAANMADGRIVTWASEVDDFFGGWWWCFCLNRQRF